MMSGASPVHEILPEEGYDIDSDDYDPEEEWDELSDEVHDRFAEEGAQLTR